MAFRRFYFYGVSCKITHLLCCVPPDVVQAFLPRYDTLLCASLDRICRSDSAWYQATLPFRLGGLSLWDSVNAIVPSYLGCCNDVWSLSCSLLDLPYVVFPMNLLYVLHCLVAQITHLLSMLFKYPLTMNAFSLSLFHS